MLRVIPKVNEGIVPLRRDHDDVAATPSIATRRAAPGNKFLAPKSHAAIAAVSSLNANFRFIDKHKQPGEIDANENLSFLANERGQIQIAVLSVYWTPQQLSGRSRLAQT